MSDYSIQVFCFYISVGKIYIAGGFDGAACLDSAEIYDPAVDQWTMLTDMTSRRSGVVLVALQKELIALGGYNGSDRLASGGPSAVCLTSY